MGKQFGRYARVLIPLTLIFYFEPVVALIFVTCGVMDVSRHRIVSGDLMSKYFLGNGLVTWLLSPINVLLDLICERNKLVYRIEDLPDSHQREIRDMLQVFEENQEEIIADIRQKMAGSKRGMLFYKWYGRNTENVIPAFAKNMTYLKTIGISAFSEKEATSLHFGPLRLTLRVLYNLTPLESDEIFIEVDGKKHYWHDDPLFIFDDTMLHRSVNGVDSERFCVFADILRPSRFTRAQNILMAGVQVVFKHINGIFYKRWTFLK